MSYEWRTKNLWRYSPTGYYRNYLVKMSWRNQDITPTCCVCGTLYAQISAITDNNHISTAEELTQALQGPYIWARFLESMTMERTKRNRTTSTIKNERGCTELFSITTRKLHTFIKEYGDISNSVKRRSIGVPPMEFDLSLGSYGRKRAPASFEIDQHWEAGNAEHPDYEGYHTAFECNCSVPGSTNLSGSKMNQGSNEWWHLH